MANPVEVTIFITWEASCKVYKLCAKRKPHIVTEKSVKFCALENSIETTGAMKLQQESGLRDVNLPSLADEGATFLQNVGIYLMNRNTG